MFKGIFNCYETFEQIFISNFDKHIPLMLWASLAHYMTKALRKDIMRRSQLQTRVA